MFKAFIQLFLCCYKTEFLSLRRPPIFRSVSVLGSVVEMNGLANWSRIGSTMQIASWMRSLYGSFPRQVLLAVITNDIFWFSNYVYYGIIKIY